MCMVQVAAAGQIAHWPQLLGEVAAKLWGRKGKRCMELCIAHHGDVVAT